ncbi:MAG: radical SAM protein [Deltaproteobacteria bacterium]|nr:radical SAM protein [Deltaproteobacteria bacterium]
MNVFEIFASIQGESTRAGEATVFVRLAGCNLDCAWCDTPLARTGAGTSMGMERIIKEALAPGLPQVCVTGGEPLLQKETPELLNRLVASGRTTVLMTNGSLPFGRVPEGVVKVVDIKTPWVHDNPPETSDALMRPPHFPESNLGLLGPMDEVKFVVRSRAEFEWICEWSRSMGLFDRVAAVLVGPVWGELDPGVLVDWMIEARLPLRLNLQWHKIIWGEDTGL